MRQYSSKISLTKNARGVYSLDTSIGCSSGTADNPRGCYNDCYAAKSAKLYGYNFSKTVLRHFENEAHRRKVVKQIGKIRMGFVRMGTSGDPSEDWEHTMNIANAIRGCNKEIVIITKHWTNLTDQRLAELRSLNICVNTSVSALDPAPLLANSLEQYHRLKPFCKSVLRIVSCDFNLDNPEGLRLSRVQHGLFKNEATLDTVLRVNKNNPIVRGGVIHVKRTKFLGKNALVSKFNPKTYFGKCSTCQEMCGMNINVKESHPQRSGIVSQMSFFKLKAK